jgi:hypothetical protein
MNILQGYLIFRLIGMILGMGMLMAGAYFVVGRGVMDSLTAEKIYKQEYGDAWREHYLAERHISVEDDHRKAFFGAAGLVTMTVLSYLIYRQIAPRRSGHRRSRRRHRSSFTVPN